MNYTRVFFSEKRAKEFAKIVNGEVWSYYDSFNQKLYSVNW